MEERLQTFLLEICFNIKVSTYVEGLYFESLERLIEPRRRLAVEDYKHSVDSGTPQVKHMGSILCINMNQTHKIESESHVRNWETYESWM